MTLLRETRAPLPVFLLASSSLIAIVCILVRLKNIRVDVGRREAGVPVSLVVSNVAFGGRVAAGLALDDECNTRSKCVTKGARTRVLVVASRLASRSSCSVISGIRNVPAVV